MTNWEHYIHDINKIGINDFTISKGKVVTCEELGCLRCFFRVGSCAARKREWLEKEYKEPKPWEV